MSEASGGDWPPRWELTAPESHVLSYRGGADPTEAIRLAVAELIVRQILRVDPVEPPRRSRRRKRWLLTDGPVRRSVEAPLDVVLDVVRGTARQRVPVLRPGSTMAVEVEGVLVNDLKRAIRKAFRPVDAYHLQHVAPALVDRGLLHRVPARRRSVEFDWTWAGRQADAQLTRWLEIARDDLPGWVESDPARASQFVREAGSAILLMRDSFPGLAQLRKRAEGDAGSGDVTPGGHAESRDQPTLDTGESLNLDPLGLDSGGLFDFGGLGDLGGGGGGGGGNGGGGG